MELLLTRNEMICLDDLRGGVVRCHGGGLWLTRSGDSRDHLLAAGDQTTITGRGRVVMMALQESRLQVLPAKQNGSIIQKKVGHQGAKNAKNPIDNGEPRSRGGR